MGPSLPEPYSSRIPVRKGVKEVINSHTGLVGTLEFRAFLPVPQVGGAVIVRTILLFFKKNFNIYY